MYFCIDGKYLCKNKHCTHSNKYAASPNKCTVKLASLPLRKSRLTSHTQNTVSQNL